MILCWCELQEWCDNPEHEGEVVLNDDGES